MPQEPDYNFAAVQEAGNSRIAGDARVNTVARPTKRIDGFISRVDEFTEYTQSLSARLGRSNDHLYGVEPTPGADVADEPPMNGSYDQLMVALSQLDTALRDMEHQITRTEENS